jgi:hypothetical protein
MRLSSLSWVKLPTTLCVTLVGLCAYVTYEGGGGAPDGGQSRDLWTGRGKETRAATTDRYCRVWSEP